MRFAPLACVLLAPLMATACPPPDPPGDDAGPESDAGPDTDAGVDDEELRTALDDAGDLADLRGANGFVKFLLQVDGVEPLAPILTPCVFQNTTLYDYHLPFLLAQPGGEDLTYAEYVAYVITRATRVWWGGQVAWLENAVHPVSGENGVLAYGIYTRDNVGDRLLADDIREVDAILRECTPYYDGTLAFSPQSQEQLQTATLYADELAGEGIAVLLP